MYAPSLHVQGCAHTGRERSAPTTTQLCLPTLKLKIACFYHHSERIIVLKCYIQYNIIPFSLQLSHHSDHSGQNPDMLLIIHICMFMHCQYIYCKNFAKPSHICMDKNFAEFNFTNSVSYPPGSSGWNSRTFIMFACT